MSKPTCSTCIYLEDKICKRYPKTSGDLSHGWRSYQEHNDWCGEHQELDKRRTFDYSRSVEVVGSVDVWVQK